MRAFVPAVMLVCAAALPGLAATVEERTAPCLACHGEKGQSENPEVPSLGAQPPLYTLIQLYLFREKQHRVELMNEAAKDLTDNDLREFSDFIAKLPAPKPPEGAVESARIEHGRMLVQQHRCGFCHNPDFSGHDNIPRIAAQREDYLIKALREYKNNTRPGYDASMGEVVQPINDADFLDLGYYIARVP